MFVQCFMTHQHEIKLLIYDFLNIQSMLNWTNYEFLKKKNAEELETKPAKVDVDSQIASWLIDGRRASRRFERHFPLVLRGC